MWADGEERASLLPDEEEGRQPPRLFLHGLAVMPPHVADSWRSVWPLSLCEHSLWATGLEAMAPRSVVAEPADHSGGRQCGGGLATRGYCLVRETERSGTVTK